MKWLIGALVFSMLPIWRKVPDGGGLNLWQFMHFTPEENHIPYNEAVAKAREAYFYYESQQ